MYGNLSNNRIARWRLLLEEYGPTYVHVAGKNNVVADALSRMDADFEQEMPSADNIVEMSNALSKEKDEVFPMSPQLIAKYQRKDKTLIKALTKDLDKSKYLMLTVEGAELVSHEGKI